MNKLKLPTVPILIFIVITSLILVMFSGCVMDDELSGLSNNAGSASEHVPDVNITEQTDIADSSGVNETPFTVSLKKTGVTELENGYSLRVLEIDKEKEQIKVSLRKDGNEYDVRTLASGATYNIKDTRDLNIIYTVTVDNIPDNSFVVELTLRMKPDIMDETDTYVGEITKNEVAISEDTLTRTYRWQYENTEFAVQYEYSTEAYDMYSERSRDRDFVNYVNDPYDDKLISTISTQMGELAEEAGYSENEIPYIAMAFVQSLPYVSDSASAGYDEYPRFPFETLYHGGGDCEDSAFLLAAILYEMGYGVALIELPDHMAVGVKGESNLEGSYYDYSGIRYYYLETTNSGWDVGVIPDKYVNTDATVIPIYEGYPELSIVFSGSGETNGQDTYVNLDIDIRNVGCSAAEDVVIYTTLETTTENILWDDVKEETGVDLDVEEAISYKVTNLYVPAGQTYRVGIWAWGSNTDAEYVYSEWTSA